MATVAVWFVFHDPALDVRLVIAGALLPDVADAGFGGARVFHTLAASVVLLVGVMLATRGHRRVRRRLLGLPMGTLLHLALDGAWTNRVLFWWPAFGPSFHSAPLPALDRPLVVVLIEETIGLAAVAWAWRTFSLGDPEARRAFLRTGRLDDGHR
jgi:hypothetical protein